MAQIIAFIHAPYFSALLDDAEDVGFNIFDHDRGLYTDPADRGHVYYVLGPGEYESKRFEQQLAATARILLIPDKYMAFDRYVPEQEVGILFHGQTDQKRVVKFRGSPLFCGDKYSNEIVGTPYEAIARQISEKTLNDFDSIWEDITLGYQLSTSK